MKLKWQVEIKQKTRGTMVSDHNSVFELFNGRLYHTYSDLVNGYLVVMDFDLYTGKYKSRYIPYSKNSNTHKINDVKYIDNGDKLLLCTQNNAYIINSLKIKKLRKKSQQHTKHISCADRKYEFENLLVHFPSPRTIECIDSKTGKQLWKYSLKGYPYTKVEYINNHLFFGTAGKGGALYCIQLDNGEIKRDYSTKGTVNYCWYNGCILTYTDKGNLQLLDPYSNEQIYLFKLDTQVGQGVPMIIVNDCLYTISFSRKNKDIWPKPTYLICINLLDNEIR